MAGLIEAVTEVNDLARRLKAVTDQVQVLACTVARLQGGV